METIFSCIFLVRYLKSNDNSQGKFLQRFKDKEALVVKLYKQWELLNSCIYIKILGSHKDTKSNPARIQHKFWTGRFWSTQSKCTTNAVRRTDTSQIIDVTIKYGKHLSTGLSVVPCTETSTIPGATDGTTATSWNRRRRRTAAQVWSGPVQFNWWCRW